jgi:sugar phosphate isomerase/epimerase
MQIFASTTSLGHGRTDLADILPAMLDLGLDGIEFGSTHLWRPDLASIIERHRPARVLTHNYFPPASADLVINLASPDAKVRQASIAHARACIDFAADVGAELYTVHPGFMAISARAATRRMPGAAFDFDFVGTGVPYQQAFELMRDALGDLLDHAQRAGVRLAIETEGSISRPGMLLMERPDEYRRLFSEVGTSLMLNFNLAHSSLAAKLHGFSLSAFIAEFAQYFAAVEVSHNDGEQDNHRSLIPGSYVFRWLPLLPDVPLILEFREASESELRRSAELLLVQAISPIRP